MRPLLGPPPHSQSRSPGVWHVPTLNAADVAFLLNTLDLDARLRGALAQSGGGPGRVRLSDDVADELRDLCTARFDVVGLDPDYGLTDEGTRLEDLIDKLFVG